MKDITLREPVILCRPLGGLNDVLCQVDHCRRISIALRRRVWVQTETGSPTLDHRFGQDFYSIFEPQSKRFVRGNEVADFSTMNWDWPEPFIHGSSDRDPSGTSLEELSHGSVLQAPLTLRNGWQRRNLGLLVHEAWGGGLSSATVLRSLNLAQNLIDHFQAICDLLPRDVIAIHFRNSDYQADPDLLSNQIHESKKAATFLVASDDLDLFRGLQRRFPEKNFLSAHQVVASTGGLLPRTSVAVLELLTLSVCRELIVIPLDRSSSASVPKLSIPIYSGFSRLAKHLWAVNVVRERGFIRYLTTREPFQGLSSHSNRIFRFFYIALYALPRIVLQAWFPSGLYLQLRHIP